MKKLKIAYITICVSMLALASCEQNATKKEVGNTRDTNNVTEGGGGPPIRDTATINKDRKDSAKMQASDSTRRGNVDPSGHVTPPTRDK